MSNASVTKRPNTSSVHIVITTLLGMIVTALCCYTFYVFRTSSSREQSLTDAMKVIRAATEIVASIAERGLPSIRSRIDELEGRGRVLEQNQRKTGLIIDRLHTTQIPVPPSPGEPITSEATMLAARKAARASQMAGQQPTVST